MSSRSAMPVEMREEETAGDMAFGHYARRNAPGPNERASPFLDAKRPAGARNRHECGRGGLVPERALSRRPDRGGGRTHSPKWRTTIPSSLEANLRRVP